MNRVVVRGPDLRVKTYYRFDTEGEARKTFPGKIPIYSTGPWVFIEFEGEHNVLAKRTEE